MNPGLSLDRTPFFFRIGNNDDAGQDDLENQLPNRHLLGEAGLFRLWRADFSALFF